MRSLIVGLACVVSGLCAPIAAAQWSADPSINTPVAVGAGIQAKVRLSATADGGAFVSWWQSETAPVYWSLRLNRLTRDGVKAWPADLVVSSPDASTSLGAATVNGSFYDVNYDLKTDAAGNAVLVWTDFRALSTRNIFAQRISAAGVPQWTSGGVALTNDTTFKRDPRVVQTTDGQYAVAWFASTSPPSLRLQVLDASGTPLLATGGQAVATATTASRPPDRFELVPSTAGSVIMAWVKEFSTSSSAQRWIVAQKFAVLPTVPPGPSPWGPQWNAGTPVTVSDQNIAIQVQTSPFAANYPRVALAPTPDGGCVVGFFDARSGTRTVYAQRLSASGAPLWDVNGVPTSTDAFRERLEPALAHEPTTGSTWVFSRESTTGLQAVGVQRLTASGTRALGDTPLLVTPLTSSFKYALVAGRSGTGAIASWMDDPASTPAQQSIAAARVNLDGASTWPVAAPTLAGSASTKNFVQHPLDTSPAASVARDGFAISLAYPTGLVAAWQDTRSGDADVYAQQINTCGTLGLLGVSDYDQSGARSIDDIFIFLADWFAGSPGADADGSGDRDIDDIFVFLNRWFAGC